MKEAYLFFLKAGFNIIEVYNPFNGEVDVILYSELNLNNSDCTYITGIDLTSFLKRELISSRDNIISFKTNFEAELQKSTVLRVKYSKQFAYKQILY